MLLGVPRFTSIGDFTTHGPAHRDKSLVFCTTDISGRNFDESRTIVRLSRLKADRALRYKFSQLLNSEVLYLYKTILVFVDAMLKGYFLCSLSERPGHISLMAERPTSLVVGIPFHKFVSLEYHSRGTIHMCHYLFLSCASLAIGRADVRGYSSNTSFSP